jgi:hypothetical protein
MDKQNRAYTALLRGIQQFVRDTVDKYSDKTYTGLIKAYDSVEDEYTVEINGVEYSHVSTTGGRCNIYETVHVLVPQGNFSNMFILKGGGSSSSGSTTPSDVTTETENIDFTNTF